MIKAAWKYWMAKHRVVRLCVMAIPIGLSAMWLFPDSWAATIVFILIMSAGAALLTMKLWPPEE